MFRRRTLVDPGVIALAGAIVSLAFVFLAVAMLEDAFGNRLVDALHLAAPR
jgi:hypothetical protein